MAGEKLKSHGTSVTTKYEMMEVGDVDGHVIMISESKQVYFNEIRGEKSDSCTFLYLQRIGPVS